jgi:molecular chaperone DnaK (HSP70)
MSKIAIDFGTTNTVVAVWREATDAPETLRLPKLSAAAIDGQPPLVPSLVYVLDGQTKTVLGGQVVRDSGYDLRGDDRLFASFKRGIAATSRPLKREIDETLWGDSTAGQIFLETVLQAAAQLEGEIIEELVLTVPVQSFERYLKWLRDEALAALGTQMVEQVRIVDESTAAALGYEVRAPGELVLVFDFGGGTLDISLVRMPLAQEEGSILIGLGTVSATSGGEQTATSQRPHPGGEDTEARVMAKAGALLGGDDIDNWLLDELLVRNELTRADVGASYPQLKRAVENAKIRLSTHESAEVSVFDPDTSRVYRATFTRAQLETLLDQHDLYSQIQRTIDKTMRAARQRGLYPEDVGAVLMVGGSSLIPSVGRMLRTVFGRERVYEHRPFEAVAHGALGLAAGIGLHDVLYHSYGIRHLSPITNRHEYEEIIAAGTRYPLVEPIEITLTASRPGQEAVELVIGEVEESASSITEVMFGDHAILMVEDGVELRRVVPLNDEDGARTVAHLTPPGIPGVDRVKAKFDVDRNRMLRVTVIDIETERTLLRDAAVVELR